MDASAKRIEKNYNVKAVKKHWDSAMTHKQAFIDEYNKTVLAKFNSKMNGLKCGDASEFYNIIWSPGKFLSKL